MIDGIKMVDLISQYNNIDKLINSQIRTVLESGQYIQGEEVRTFEASLGNFLDCPYVISCGNGTDALQLALMALDLNYNDEIILPAFSYFATVEVVCLLGLKPVFVDVEPTSFNIDPYKIENLISDKTKAIIPVHLYGQCANMEPLLALAKTYNLKVIEDCAQSLGSIFKDDEGNSKYSGTIGDIGCTSFFPTKNLGCYGDGGAIFTRDKELASRLRMLANHGQKEKYVHSRIGINSRLDTIQAAILNIKLSKLNEYNLRRYQAAQLYKKFLKGIDELVLPLESDYSTHIYHQFTIQVDPGLRDNLCKYLKSKGIPTMIYYPIPLHLQEAISNKYSKSTDGLLVSEKLCSSVLSLPMHTELTLGQIETIAKEIRNFYYNKTK